MKRDSGRLISLLDIRQPTLGRLDTSSGGTGDHKIQFVEHLCIALLMSADEWLLLPTHMTTQATDDGTVVLERPVGLDPVSVISLKTGHLEPTRTYRYSGDTVAQSLDAVVELPSPSIHRGMAVLTTDIETAPCQLDMLCLRQRTLIGR